MDRNMVGVSAEFLVAGELARRDVYAQPTFGNLKRTDLLAFQGGDRPIRIEVKGKQGKTWPACKGVPNGHSILIFVDFSEKRHDERPDFYVLLESDWVNLVQKRAQDRPEKRIAIDDSNCPVWTTEVRNGRQHRGMEIRVSDISEFLEAWGKVGEASD